MTNPNIPKWVQAAIAKLTEKHDEKRQTFKERGDRYHDGFADGLDAAETIFMRELERVERQLGSINPIEIERRAFEAWQYTQNNRDRLKFHYSSNAQSGIEYKDISIDYAWQGWLAAKQNAAQQTA